MRIIESTNSKKLKIGERLRKEDFMFDYRSDRFYQIRENQIGMKIENKHYGYYRRPCDKCKDVK
jgi:hypothetical protein